jgi:hypothetical protein
MHMYILRLHKGTGCYTIYCSGFDDLMPLKHLKRRLISMRIYALQATKLNVSEYSQTSAASYLVFADVKCKMKYRQL